MVSSPHYSCLNLSYDEVMKMPRSKRKFLIKKLNKLRNEEKKEFKKGQNSGK